MRGTQLKFRCGDLVRESSGRHVGEVAAAFEWTVRVRWLGSGIKEDLDLDSVVLVESGRRAEGFSAQVLRNRKRIGME